MCERECLEITIAANTQLPRYVIFTTLLRNIEKTKYEYLTSAVSSCQHLTFSHEKWHRRRAIIVCLYVYVFIALMNRAPNKGKQGETAAN